MGNYSINNIVSALRGAAGGQTDEQKAALAEKDAAARLRALQEEQAGIDEFNQRAIKLSLPTRENVMENGIPVKKPIAAAADETEVAGDTDNEGAEGESEQLGVKGTLIQSICETRWAQEADPDPTRKAEFMANCIASKGKTGYSLLQ